ncbi:MAG: glutathione binding-like protein [Burkholderiaceae bacterium]|nr:glutathione S-transferase C-terminal domain-containing protein [Betaproteobacteria bacterium]MDO7580250.1 glutathione binding-like protein [Burkholderiaceae bacterium]MDO7679862.1 glutathione binding-like protein [Burkholderiaceae bacterium]MDO7704125.1 glutathione binding-like protein [Burkholderiaceae bacterium]MDO7717654.1 glutathione binding-like protein [Burkholderiaceae bacterium]
MIDIYSWATPNGHKVHIMLEECGQRLGRDWQAHPINIGTGDQFQPAFLEISPNNKIPAMVDPKGPNGKPMHLFESGAILLYLASKFNRFLPKSDAAKFETLQWLMFQMGGVGPMLGQAHHFRIYAPEKIDYAYDRYTNEAKRLYGVLDKQVQKHPYIAGKQYTVADIATFPWLRSWQNQGIDWKNYPALRDWFDRVSERPAVKRGGIVLAHLRKPLVDDQARQALFGKDQYVKR